MLTLGAKLVSRVVDKEERQEYACQIAGVRGPDEWNGLIPMFSTQGEPVLVPKMLPSIRVKLDAIDLAMERWHSYQIDQRTPAFRGRKVDIEKPDGTVVQGYSNYEERRNPWPFNLTFAIQLRARYMNDAMLMFDYALRHIQPRDWIEVFDSNGERRQMDAFLEGSAVISDIADIEARTAGFELSYRVEALIDSMDPYVVQAMTGWDVRTHKAPPFPGG